MRRNAYIPRIYILNLKEFFVLKNLRGSRHANESIPLFPNTFMIPIVRRPIVRRMWIVSRESLSVAGERFLQKESSSRAKIWGTGDGGSDVSRFGMILRHFGRCRQIRGTRNFKLRGLFFLNSECMEH